MEKRKQLIEDILTYQKLKNDKIKKITGVELIPTKYALTFNDVNKNLNRIIDGFKPTDSLKTINCLHCNIYFDKGRTTLCSKDCPYNKNNDNCFSKKSTYDKCVENAKVYLAYSYVGKIGDRLKDKLDEYKKMERKWKS